MKKILQLNGRRQIYSLTASNAFPTIDRNGPDWDHYRSLGKRTNF